MQPSPFELPNERAIFMQQDPPYKVMQETALIVSIIALAILIALTAF